MAVGIAMYGHRRAIVYKALRNITQNEEILMHYGQWYFTGRQLNCICNNQAQPHVPQGNGPDFPW